MVLAKRRDLEDNLKEYLQDLSNLLASFGVASKIRCTRYYDEDRVAVTLHIMCNTHNILRFIDRIGFHYNTKKYAHLAKIRQLILDKQSV